MKLSIMKRIETLEKRLAAAENPSSIMIFYDDLKKKFCVREYYIKANANKKNPGDFRTKENYINNLEDYIFRGDYACSVILDLCAVPSIGEAANLYCFKIGEVQKAADIGRSGFSVRLIGEVEKRPPEGQFEIITFERGAR